jgi:hypothetical protein
MDRSSRTKVENYKADAEKSIKDFEKKMEDYQKDLVTGHAAKNSQLPNSGRFPKSHPPTRFLMISVLT